MAGKRKRKKKTLRQRYVAYRRWQTRRAKVKAQAARELNRLDRDREKARAVTAKERAEHKARVQERREERKRAAEQRMRDKEAQQTSVVVKPRPVVIGSPAPAKATSSTPAPAQQAAGRCGAPTEEGGTCERPAFQPGECGIDSHKGKGSGKGRICRACGNQVTGATCGICARISASIAASDAKRGIDRGPACRCCGNLHGRQMATGEHCSMCKGHARKKAAQ